MSGRTLRRRTAVLLLLSLLWMTVIFCLSGEDAEKSTESSMRVARTVAVILEPEFRGWTPEQQEAYVRRIDHPVRKAAHMTEYLILGTLLHAACSCLFADLGWKSGQDCPGRRRPSAFTAALCLGVIYAVSDELHQLFISGRAGMAQDVLIDSIGVLLGLLSSACMFRLAKSIMSAAS